MFDLGTTLIKLNYFYLTNRQDLRKWWVLTLIALAIFSTVFVITNAVIYVINIPKQDALLQAIAASPLDYGAIRATNQPIPLAVADAVVLPARTGRYDAVAQVTNTNKNWAATEVAYAFSVAGQTTEGLTGAVMPASEQYLAAYNLAGPESSAGVSGTIEITDVTWVRVADPAALPKADFSFTDLQFGTSATTTGQTVYRVTGRVTNNSFTGFWKVKLQVVLLSNGAMVGINSIFLEKFLSGESRSLYTQWDTVTGTVGSVSVVPAVNLLDTANLIR